MGKDNIDNLTAKENIDLVTSEDSKGNSVPKGQDKSEATTTFIQYYMKSLSMPSIGHKVILENVGTLLTKKEEEVSYLWTNPKNL
jgi:hypothetical protein